MGRASSRTCRIFFREHIASFFTRDLWSIDRKTAEATVNLANTSEIQRRAVLESIPRTQRIILEYTECSEVYEPWVKLLADHIRDLELCVYSDDLFPTSALEKCRSVLPLLPLLRGARLKRVAIIGPNIFLDALRDAKGVLNLNVGMYDCSHRSLISMLRRRGRSLSRLLLECRESCSEMYDPSSPKSPLSICSRTGSRVLTSLCPNPKSLVIKCCHIAPSTTALWVSKLPFLQSMKLLENEDFCDEMETTKIDLSEDDIVKLRTLDRVSVENLAGGVRVAAQIGSPIVSVKAKHQGDLDAALELVNCPKLSELDMEMSFDEMTRFTSIVAQLPNLSNVRLSLTSEFSLKEFCDVVMESVQILRVCRKPGARIVLFCEVPEQEPGSPEELDMMVSKVAVMEGAKVEMKVKINAWRAVACAVSLHE